MKGDLPIYDIVLSEDDIKQGVGRISLVDDPAIKVGFIKLRKQDAIELDFSVTLTDRGLCFGCPPNGDGTTKSGEPDKRCKEKGDGGAGKSPVGSSKPSSTASKTNNIPKSASSYNDIPDSEMAKTIDKNSLPEATNSHENYLNALMSGNPNSWPYYDGQPINTLNDAIFEYTNLVGPNANESAVVNWSKKVKFK